jgi:membrane-bound ClpP family serine protease
VLWKAICHGFELEAGDEVEVIGMEGLRLVVKPKEAAPNRKTLTIT